MKYITCYCISLNIGKIEVWSSNLYLNKESALAELYDSKNEIVEQISANSLLFSETSKAFRMIENSIVQLTKNGSFKDKENELDFFIIEQPVFEFYKSK